MIETESGKKNEAVAAKKSAFRGSRRGDGRGRERGREKEIAATEGLKTIKGKGGGRRGKGIKESESLVVGTKKYLKASKARRQQKGIGRRSERIRTRNNLQCKEYQDERGRGMAGKVRRKWILRGVSRYVKKQAERNGPQKNKVIKESEATLQGKSPRKQEKSGEQNTRRTVPATRTAAQRSPKASNRGRRGGVDKAKHKKMGRGVEGEGEGEGRGKSDK